MEIPIIITDIAAQPDTLTKERIIFVDVTQLRKAHVFLPVQPECYARVKTPMFAENAAALILTHRKGQFPNLDAVDANTLDFIKRMTIGRYAVNRALTREKSSSRRRCRRALPSSRLKITT